jgi:hypothetical protein
VIFRGHTATFSLNRSGGKALTAEQNVVTVEGGKAAEAERDYLCHGISTRMFER